MNTKAQEEIVGFVAIIVIVTIVGIVFLGFIIKSEDNQESSSNRDLLRFMESALVYTSNCTLDFGYTYKDLKELTKTCYTEPDRKCLNGESVCLNLNSTLREILKAGWGEIDNSTYIKGYTYISKYTKNLSENSQTDEFLVISEGSCKGSNTKGYNLPISINVKEGGRIDASIKLCT